MKKTTCSKCNYEFANKGGNFNRHFQSCNGTYFPHKKLTNCKYCNLDFALLNTSERANHSRWCKFNPNQDLDINKQNLAKARQAKKNFENQYTKAKKEGREVPISPRKGKTSNFVGRTHSEETKRILREKALASPHRRLKKGTVKYKGITLDSSWELELAKRLDQLEIEWIRPKCIPWKDQNGIIHNYFPDFYLPLFDVFLDPKNPFAMKVQQNKLEMLLMQYKNIIFLTSLEECKNFNIK